MAGLTGQLAPGGEAPAGGEKKLSKNALKKLQKGKKEKAPKDANRWAVDETKKAAKAAEKAAKAAATEEKLRLEAAAQVATPKGQKKIMTPQMASVYRPEMVEAAWQDWWEAAGYYSADAAAGAAAGPEGRFVLVIPPPNVTGSLHLGHALTAAIEDTLTRWHRMNGKVALYVPGTDHAGIATQSVVEKQLMKTTGQTRHDLGREAFLKKVWEWKGQYGDRICRQIRELGSSVDWSREAFTMDDKCSKAVVEAFCRFHESGILFRDKRLINWSCRLKSAISDIEVDHEDIEGGAMRAVPGHTKRPKYQFGMFTEFAYKVVGSDEEVVVATTRLETMLGDTAVAVHPADPRYAHLHGKRVAHPFHPHRSVPIVTDAVLVDMALGTGAVKITPAHDPNDYECGKRHGLAFITVLTPDGAINEEGGPQFQGMMRYDARIAVEEALDRLGLLRAKYPKPMKLGVCSRSGDVIEPMVMPQWFVDCDDMAARAVQAVKQGDLKIRPEFHEKTWFQWLENSRPWCVSRQLWWGHRIPAYFACTAAEAQAKGGEGLDKNAAKYQDRWVVSRSAGAARAAAAALLQVPEAEVVLAQDEDVLDTWFSSGLFPFSVMGWPDQTADLAGFFPTSLLETGLDILFFWVARMVMMSLQLTDQLPFTDVYLHAMVRDKEGRKMSKSLGNVIDPLEVIHGCDLATLHAKLESGNLAAKEVAKAKKDFDADFAETGGIPKCGADALRIGLLAYTVQGRDINLDIKRVVGYRNFCNKLWQSCRFLLGCFGDFAPSAGMAAGLLGAAHCAPRDRWVLARLADAVDEVTGCFQAYEFGKAVQALDVFFRGKLCDVYLELCKPSVYATEETEAAVGKRDQARAVLWTCLDMGLRLLHPICPFVTEELWQRLPGRFAHCDDNDNAAAAARLEEGGPGGGPGGKKGKGKGKAPESIMVSAWPSVESEPALAAWGAQAQNRGGTLCGGAAAAGAAGSVDGGMEAVLGAVEGARSLRSDLGLLKKPAAFTVVCADAAALAALQAQHDDFATLAFALPATAFALEGSAAHAAAAAQGLPVKLVSDAVKVFVDPNSVAGQGGGGGGGGQGGGSSGSSGVDHSVQLGKLRKEAKKMAPLVAKLEAKMENAAYLAKTPAAAQAKDREKLESYGKQLKDAQAAIARIEKQAAEAEAAAKA